MKVSVVICTYAEDMYEHFCEAAESVFDQTHTEVELVIVVDGNEELFKRVDEDYGDREDVVIHCNDENVGLLESRNTGAKIATGDVVAFIDDDAVANEEWVEELVDSYEQHNALAVGGKMAPSWVAGKPEFLPEEFYWLIGVTHRGFAAEPGWVRNTFGSNISFERDAFQDLSGFNTEIGGRKGDANLQGGETELCARLKETYGQGVWYNPNAVVAHKVFKYRTEPGWLIDRAFWQGYSKYAMKTFIPESNTKENEFLKDLLTEHVIRRVKDIIQKPKINKLLQLMTLALLTFVVGCGYLYGSIKYYPE